MLCRDLPLLCVLLARADIHCLRLTCFITFRWINPIIRHLRLTFNLLLFDLVQNSLKICLYLGVVDRVEADVIDYRGQVLVQFIADNGSLLFLVWDDLQVNYTIRFPLLELIRLVGMMLEHDAIDSGILQAPNGILLTNLLRLHRPPFPSLFLHHLWVTCVRRKLPMISWTVARVYHLGGRGPLLPLTATCVNYLLWGGRKLLTAVHAGITTWCCCDLLIILLA